MRNKGMLFIRYSIRRIGLNTINATRNVNARRRIVTLPVATLVEGTKTINAARLNAFDGVVLKAANSGFGYAAQAA